MSLIRFDEVSVEFGDQPVLADADLAIEENERICIIGRNGAGKSTTLKLISGTLQPDRGEITRRRDIGISQLVQTLPVESEQTVRAYVGDALAHLFELRDRWERAAAGMPAGGNAAALEDLQHELDARDGWRPEQRVDEILSDLGLPADKRLSELSGGWRRRVSLARALVTRPDLLLLDEPTNHLDLETIRWLEDRVLGYPGSVVFITHDRAFLQRLATRIVEIDRGRLVSWPGDYDRFLRGRDEALHAEAEANARFDKKLAEEEVWIRQGIKARRTRNEGRVRALEAMREEAGQRRKREGSARIHIESAEQSGRKVIQMHNVSYSYGREPLIRDLSLLVRRGDRIGLIGNNGVGKSTLLRLMLGELQPDRGTVKFGTNLEIGYFDQLRRELDETRTVAETVGDGNDYVMLNGKSRHVIGYLKGFLFSPKRAQSPIAALSGGERNRVVLARLFTQPANLLVLDEPTNDLDIETLEVLEDRLVDYPGTLIVVSHDRRFLDNVVTSTLVFESDGDVHRYVGNFSDWQARNRELAADREAERVAAASRDNPVSEPARRKTKLSYHEQRRLDALPGRIAKLEARQAELQARIAGPGFYEQDYEDTAPVLHELAELERDIESATEEWLTLEEKSSAMRDGA